MKPTSVHAAGGVVWRRADDRIEVAVIDRPKYRDVSLPKGKVDPGETLAQTAVREIFEETGVRVTLGVPLGVVEYRLPSKRTKIVHYWAAEARKRAVRDAQFEPNREISNVRWMTIKKARKTLSYPVDVHILDRFARLIDLGVTRTFPVIALRHGTAVPREDWPLRDRERPLAARGRAQAKALVGPLAAFGVTTIVTSPATRCTATVAPLAKKHGLTVEHRNEISQDAWERGAADARTVVRERLMARTPAVVCSHGPVLPSILSEMSWEAGALRGAYLGSASALETGSFSVLHVPSGEPGLGIVAVETHEAPA